MALNPITDGMTGAVAATTILDNDKKAFVTDRWPYDDYTTLSTVNETAGLGKFVIDMALFIPYQAGNYYSFGIIETSGIVRFYRTGSIPVAAPVQIGSITVTPIGDGSGLYAGYNAAFGYLVCDFAALTFPGGANILNIWTEGGAGLSKRVFRTGITSDSYRRLILAETNITALQATIAPVPYLAQQDVTGSVFEFAPESTAAFAQETSTFSGWGLWIGPRQNFGAIMIKVKSRSQGGSTTPITQVRGVIRSGGSTGTILADVTMNVNIPIGQTQYVAFSFPTITNPGAANLWFQWYCNSYCSLFAISTTNYPYNNQGLYEGTKYSTDGNMSVIFSSGSTNYVTWFQVGASATYVLSDQQLAYIAANLPGGGAEIIMPSKIYAIVGDKLQLFHRGFIKTKTPYVFDLLTTCLKGANYPRYFEYTPVIGDVGTTNYKLDVKDSRGNVITTGTTSLVTRNAVASPATNLKIVAFGDSLTGGGEWVTEASRRLTGTGGTPAGNGFSNITFCGAKGTGNAKYFGVGGWFWNSYSTAGYPAYRFTVSGVSSLSVGAVYTNNGFQYTITEINVTAGTGTVLGYTVLSSNTPTASGTLTKISGAGDATIAFSSATLDTANPFWVGGQLTFIPYANAYCGGTIDVMVSLLTWNNLIPWKTNFDDVKVEIRKILDKFHIEFPAGKFKIMGIQLPDIAGGMGANYGATGTSYADGYGMYVTALNMNKAYQDLANETAYSTWVEFIHVAAQFDVENNMQSAATPVNSRNTATEKRGTNGVHPSNDGYNQIADVFYRMFVANFCQ